MSHLQYTAKSHHLQWNIQQLSKICHKLYREYCPEDFKFRRNVKLSKVSDESLLVLLLLQTELGIKSQRHFYRICQLFPCGHLLERSLFKRRARQLIWLVQVNGLTLNVRYIPNTIVMIGSFPLPLYQPIRNYRTRIHWLQGFQESMVLWVQGTYAGYFIRLYSELPCHTSLCSRL